MSHLSRYTAAEAAFVLREPVRAVRKALDAGPVRPFLLQRAGAAVRAIDWRDLLYLYAVRALREELTPKARMDLYEAVRQTPIDRDGEVRFGRLRVSVADRSTRWTDAPRISPPSLTGWTFEATANRS